MEPKLSLDLLNRLVGELNKMKDELERMEDSVKLSTEDRHLMILKMMGVASGVSSEGAALIGDLGKLSNMAFNKSSKADIMSLFESLSKKPTGASGN